MKQRLAAMLMAFVGALGPVDAQGQEVSFSRDVFPILADRCFACHGPDGEDRKAKLRLDVRDEAVKERKGGTFAIVPGEMKESELIYRIMSDDPEERMPPKESKLSLTAKQKSVLKQLVSEGAKYEPHWAYLRPKRHALPQVEGSNRVRNEIDNFILAELE